MATKDIRELYANSSLTITGTSSDTIVTPAGLKATVDSYRGNANTASGGTDNTKFMTSKNVKDNYLPLSGGTVSNSLTVNMSSPFWDLIDTNVSTPSGKKRTRWLSTAGYSYYQILQDNGTWISNPLSIDHATGKTTFSVRPDFAGATPWDNLNFNPANYTIKGDEIKAAIAYSSTSNDVLNLAGITEQPTFIFDPVRSEYFARGSGEWASPAAMIAGISGSTYTRASTATYFGQDGLMKTAIAGEIRVDYDPLTRKRLGILLEPSRTNLIVNSGNLSSGSPSGATRTANAALSPDGTLTMSRLTSTVTGGTNTAYLDMIVTVASDTVTRTFSAYIRQGTSPTSTINFFYGGGTFVQVIGTINWTTKTISGAGTTMTDCGGGLYRVTATLANNNSGNTQAVCRIYVRDQGTANVTGHYVDTGSWQLEVGGAATSYIPTAGATVTRSADALMFGGGSWINSSAMSALAEFQIKESRDNSTTTNIFKLQNAAGTNYSAIREGIVIAGADFLVSSGGVNQVDSLSYSTVANTKMRMTIGLDASGFDFSSDGSSPFTGGGITPPVGLDRMDVGSNGMSGHISRIVFFAQRLSSAKVQVLSAITWATRETFDSYKYVLKTGGAFSGAVSIGADKAPGAELEVHAMGGDNDVRIQLRANDTHIAQIGTSDTAAFFDAGNGKAMCFYTGGTLRFTIGSTGTMVLSTRPYFNGNLAWDAGNLVAPIEEAPTDSSTYARKNGAWVKSVGGAVMSDVAPTSPENGQKWVRTTDMMEFTWYVDADGGQWVSTNTGMDPTIVLVKSNNLSDLTSVDAAVTNLGVGHGQCRLVYTNTTTLTLMPFNGNRIVINGLSRPIPSAGVTIGIAGNWTSASQHRYIYAYWTGSAIALEASVTGHSMHTDGVEIKTGDPTRTLVGMAYSVAGPTFGDNTTTRYVASWFNRRKRRLVNNSISGTSATSVTNLSGTFLSFISWNDALAHSQFHVTIDVPATSTGTMYMMYDGVQQTQVSSYVQAATGNWFDVLSSAVDIDSHTENIGHYFSVSGTVGAGTMGVIGTPTHTGWVEI